MNQIEITLTLLEKLIKLCKDQKREIDQLKKEVNDRGRIIHDLRIKWQDEMNKRLTMR